MRVKKKNLPARMEEKEKKGGPNALVHPTEREELILNRRKFVRRGRGAGLKTFWL